MTTIWQRLQNDFFDSVSWLEKFLSSTAEAEVAVIAPLAEAAVVQLGTDLVANPPSSLGAFAQTASQVLLSTAKAAESAGIKVAGSSLVSAVGGALANAQAGLAPSAGAPPSPLAPSSTS